MRTNKLNTLKRRIRKKVKYMIYPESRPVGAVLMYHRIGDQKPDPWELFVGEKNFKEQLTLLKRYYQVSPLSRMEQIVSQKTGRRKHIFITFDDGCIDNFEIAAPLLKEFHFQATFFIPSLIMKGETIFWWEILDAVFWQMNQLPPLIHLWCKSGRFEKDIGSAMRKRNPEVEDGWSAHLEPPPTERCRLYLELCNWIRMRPAEDQLTISSQLISLYYSQNIHNKYFRKLSEDQIISLTKGGFDIGAHTVNHPALSFHGFEIQKEEILSGKRSIENLTRRPVTTFAYPHGEHNKDTMSILQNNNVRIACTTNGGGVYKNTDTMLLPRVLMRDKGSSWLKHHLNHLFYS